MRARATLISDPTMVDLYGTRTLLMHGDTLCTDDVDYQKFRATARDPRFQQDFLAQPIEARRQRVGQLRELADLVVGPAGQRGVGLEAAEPLRANQNAGGRGDRGVFHSWVPF